MLTEKQKAALALGHAKGIKRNRPKGLPYIVHKVNPGWFKKGKGFWTDKKRPNLKNTNAASTFFKKGQTPWNKGLLLNERVVGYAGLHAWVKRQNGKAKKCINGHIAKRYYWANKSGEYKRDLNDWHELCQSCNERDGIKKHERFKS